MKKRPRPRGRPKNKLGIVQLWRFARAGIVMCVYDETRERGEKHRDSVNECVEYVRKRHPKIPVSQTEVKRILATFRPRNSRTILRFKRSTLSKKKLKLLRSIRDQFVSAKGEKDLRLPRTPGLPKSPVAYTFGFGERPHYPRHNRKISNE
jgi:predicted transcriptional regulator